MPQKPDAYYRPDNLPEALRLLSQPNVFVLAGGTNLLTGDVAGAVVDLQGLGLNQIQHTAVTLHLGATVTLANLVDWLREQADPTGMAGLLLQAIRQAGPNTYRHAATVGGVIASRLPDSELLAALLVLETGLEMQTPEPASLTLADYLLAEERPSGLITHVVIPWGSGRFAAERVARTPADAPIVSVTGWQPEGGRPRLAATGIGPRPTRLAQAEAALAAGDAAAAVQASQSAGHHPGDFRGDAAYRQEMTAVLARRVLAELGE
ncbi:MAG: FAD binding domain-containing protein [Chloroflexi bacterium]|nr:FAD binding domain-containing protein [Chloroflexota bacterium]